VPNRTIEGDMGDMMFIWPGVYLARRLSMVIEILFSANR
ncbi:unnamed protein product, partial [Acidithrix sp. C25]